MIESPFLFKINFYGKNGYSVRIYFGLISVKNTGNDENCLISVCLTSSNVKGTRQSFTQSFELDKPP